MAPREPTRLFADPGASPLLRSLLSDARSALPSPGDVERISARVDAAIAAGLPAPDISLGSSVGGTAGSKALVVAASLVVGAALVAVGWVAVRGAGQAVQRDLPPSSVVDPAWSPSPPSPAQPAAAASDQTDLPESPAALAPRGPEPRAAGMSEASLLDLARAELARNPRRALGLTEEHRRRFPSGALAQEREVIAIEALSRMGQTTEARNRGSDFERRYPDSAHRQKVEQAIRDQ